MICVYTKAGRNKTHSEDSVLVAKEVVVDSNRTFPCAPDGFVCIADGVGGHAGGAVASSLVVHSLSELDEKKEIDIRSAVLKINEDLLKKARSEVSVADMATTLTGFLFRGEEVQLFHIGNTRAYVFQGDYIKQLTSDHTVYNYLRSMQRYEEAEKCNKNEITNCLGGGNENYASKLCVMPIPKAKKYMLTSDGIHEYVTLDYLESVMLQDTSIQDKCAQVVQEALNNGSCDDLSIVIIEFEEET